MFRGIHLIPANTKIDFMRIHKAALVFFLSLLIGTFVLLATKGLKFGIDFDGGISIQMQAKPPQAVDIVEIRALLAKIDLAESASIQEIGGLREVMIRLPVSENTSQDVLVSKVRQLLAEKYDYRGSQFIGPKVGSELVQTAILALAMALFGICIYIWFRYEWQFGVNAIITILYDCVTMVGLYSLLGLEFDLNAVAAILTIAGYSMNDKVVLYDRVKDEMRRYKKMPLVDILNLAINRTLSRTTMTGGLTLLSVIALYLFGGKTLEGFSIALMWGIIIGTSSSIYVGTPILLYMGIRKNNVPNQAAVTNSKKS